MNGWLNGWMLWELEFIKFYWNYFGVVVKYVLNCKVKGCDDCYLQELF